MIQPWPVQITALTPAACGAARWRKAGTSWVTVVVKATFELVPGQLATLTTPREIVREDRYRERTGSVEEASETAPYLPGAGVLLAGHAYAPGGRAAPTAAARLAVARERPLLDKTVHVFGDRAPGASHPQPFQKMPLVYERAYGGAGVLENPAGVGVGRTAAQPNFLDPTSPQRPAGFGPISRYWPARKRLLGNGDERGLQASDPVIPEGFDWRYFHAAPPDQQIELLRGDEWLVLDGLHPSLPRVQTKLPSAVGRARWHLATSTSIGPAQDIPLVADMLVIDADQQLCSVVWRGRFPLERPDVAPWVRVFAGVELGGQSVVWSRSQDVSTVQLGVANTIDGPLRLGPNGPLPLQRPSPSPLAGTIDTDLRGMLASVLPFAALELGRTPSVAVSREVPQPVIRRAPESVAETSELDLRAILAAIVPFNAPRAAPSPLASTGGMDDRPLLPSLPFLPADPSRSVFAAVPQPAVPRRPSPLGGTMDADMQQAMRAILPFMGAPQPGTGAVEPFKPAKPASAPLASTGGMDDSPLLLPLPFLPADPSRPVFAAVPQPAVPRRPSPLGGTMDADTQQAMREILPFQGTPQPGTCAVEPVRVPARAIERSARLPEPASTPTVYAPPPMEVPPMQAPPSPTPPVMQAPPLMQAPPISMSPPTQGPPAGAKPTRSQPRHELAQDPFHGVSLSRYAAVQAGLAEKVLLETVLEREGIDAGVWTAADAAWSSRLAEDLGRDGALQEPFDAYLAEAQDRYGRRLPPLEDDLEAWLDFRRRFSTDTNPPALFAQLGLRLAEVARLSRTWSKRLRADPQLAARARSIQERQPPDLAISLPAPAVLS